MTAIWKEKPAIQASISGTPTWLHLPPFEWSCDPEDAPEIQFATIPFDTNGFVELYNKQHGWELPVSFRYIFSSHLHAEQFKQQLRGYLRNSDGTAKDVQLCLFVDTSNTVAGVYRNCRIASAIKITNDSNSTKWSTVSFTLKSPLNTIYQTAPDATVPGDDSPYERYLIGGTWAGQAIGGGSGGGGGGDTGDSGDGTSTGVTVIEGSRLIVDKTFVGAVTEITDSTNFLRLQKMIIPSADFATRVVGLQITGASGLTGSSGQTTIMVSDSDYDASGDTISASVTYDETASALSSGNILIGAGDPLYIYITSAGGHQDVEFSIELKLEA